jgi:predicted phage tail protein
LLGIALLIALARFLPAALSDCLDLAPVSCEQCASGRRNFALLGGVAQLLTPTPKVPQGADKQDDPRKSYSFSGIQNTSRQGVPVPIVYGETLVGSVVISAGIDTVQVAA